MDTNKELTALLTQMNSVNQKQVKLTRLQCLFSAVAAACGVAVLVVALFLWPQINGLVAQVDVVVEEVEQVTAQLAEADVEGMIANLEQVSSQLAEADWASVATDLEQVSSQLAAADWESVVTDLEEVSREIAEADLDGLARDVNTLVRTCQASVEEAMGKLNAIDLQTLNQAIDDLAAVVKPLADFFERF